MHGMKSDILTAWLCSNWQSLSSFGLLAGLVEHSSNISQWHHRLRTEVIKLYSFRICPAKGNTTRFESFKGKKRDRSMPMKCRLRPRFSCCPFLLSCCMSTKTLDKRPMYFPTPQYQMLFSVPLGVMPWTCNMESSCILFLSVLTLYYSILFVFVLLSIEAGVCIRMFDWRKQQKQPWQWKEEKNTVRI